MTPLLMLAAVTVGALPASGQTVGSDQILPKETFLYLSVPNVEVLKRETAASSMGQLWQDPSMADFKSEISGAFTSEIEAGLSQVQDVLGLSVDELLAIPSGEISIAISSAGNRVGGVLFLDFGEHEAEVQGLLDKAVAALANSSSLESADDEFDGTPLTMFNVVSPQRPKTPLAREFGWFIKDQRLVASNSKAVLESILSNWGGGSDDSLVGNDVYSYIIDKCQTDGTALSTFYFDPIGLFKKLVSTGSLGEAGMGASMALGFLPTFGIDQLKAMGGRTEVGSGEFEVVSRTMIYSEQPPRNAMRVFMLDKAAQSPPSWVKEDASAYLAMNWKVGEAYDAIEQMVDMFQGAGALEGQIDRIASRGPGIHIKNDIVDQLSGELQFVTAPSRAGANSPFGGDQLFAIGLKDSSKVADLLARITAEPGYPGTSREFQGVTLYEIEPGNGQTAGFTVANGKLLIGIGGNLLEQSLRNNDDVRPLSESDDFKRIAEHFPSDAVAVTFSRPADQYKSLYDLLQSGEAADSFPGMDEIFSRIDFTTLPSFDQIKKYIQPTGGFWVGEENGVYMQGYTLKK